MGHVVISIADCRVSADPEVEFITFSLGSCIGVTIWDPEKRVGGMLHCLLPDSALAPHKGEVNPAMFADTGLPQLFRSVYELGGVKRRLEVKIAGGARFFATTPALDIGARNYAMVRKLFWRNNVMVRSEHVGGTISRTMRLNIGTGAVSVENRKMGRLAI